MKDPAVLFYTQDFITGTLLMNYEQRGKYITLLCLQQQNGKLSEKDLMKVCGEKDEDIWTKFELHDDGFYYNGRMLNETNKRKKYTQSRIENLHMDSHMENRNKKDEIRNKNKEKEIVFKSEVFEFLEKYPEVMLNKFCDYWTEPTKGGTKLRWELEKCFDISRRLATWASRDKDYNKILKPTEHITYKEMIYRFNQGETDIQERYEPVTPGDERTLWKPKT
jgi:hypothetical protein